VRPNRVSLLWQNDDPLPVRPIPNGDFSAGLTDWTQPMRDAGPLAGHSATNPAAYRLVEAVKNGLFEEGGGDDVVVPLAEVRYDAATQAAVIAWRGGALPDGSLAPSATLDVAAQIAQPPVYGRRGPTT
jgi:hypothetical protein